MYPGGEGLDPTTKEHPDPAADADGDGLPAGGGEHPDPKEGMRSEHPEGGADDIGDIDPDEILPPGGDGDDPSASGATDSELGDIFEALKKEVPAEVLEQLPDGAREVVQNYLSEATEDARKKLQAYLTKRTQERSAEVENLRQENDQLKANSLTPPEAKFVNELVEWNDQILRDPVATIPKIIRKLVADGRLSKEKAAHFMGGSEEELFPEGGAAPEDKPLTMRDLKALREEDAKERRTREEQLRRQSDAREAGRQAINEAVRWPGFAEKNPKTGKVHFTELGMKVLESVRRREFTGPNAVRNAYKAYRAEQMEQENAALRTKTRKVADAARGATGQPGGVVPTKTKPAGTGDPWDAVMKDVEEHGLGVD